MVGLPTDRQALVDGLGAAGLKKLELAKALATGPKLLLADESLGRAGRGRDGPGRPTCCARSATSSASRSSGSSTSWAC